MASGKKEDDITNWVVPGDPSGEFKRQVSQFRNHISNDPNAEFPAEKGRYHLYVSYACPWAHRALIVRKLKGLEEIIPFTSVHWHMANKGWRFARSDDNEPGENVTADPLHPDVTHLRDIYFSVEPEYSGRFTVPTLYDKKQKKIVSNESSEIIRMFYTAFDDILPEQYKKVDLFPESLKKQIEETNEWTYNDINNGVYKSGFATTQEAYEKAVTTLFKSLDRAEEHLAKTPTRSTSATRSPKLTCDFTRPSSASTPSTSSTSSATSATSVADTQRSTSGSATSTGMSPPSARPPSSPTSRSITPNPTRRSTRLALHLLGLCRISCRLTRR